MNLQFIESPVYSDQIDDLLSAEDHRQLQMHLLEQPDRGDVIKGSGGLRKLRWAGSGRGKRGGIRVIYYLWPQGNRIPAFCIPEEPTRGFDTGTGQVVEESNRILHQ